MVAIVCASFEGTGLVFVVCSVVFKMWLRSVCSCPWHLIRALWACSSQFSSLGKGQDSIVQWQIFLLFRCTTEVIEAGGFWWQTWRNMFLLCLVLLKEVELSSSYCTGTVAWTLKDIIIPRRRSELWLYPSPEVLF